MPLPIYIPGGGATGSASTTVANVVWNDGASDGDWNDVNNWDTAAVPTSGKEVFIASSSRNITQNLTQSSINLNSLRLGHGFTGTLDGLTINAGEIRSSKRFGKTNISGTFQKVYIEDSPAGSTGLTLDGTIGDLHVLRTQGTVVINTSATVENVYIVPTAGDYADVNIGRLVTKADTTNITVTIIDANLDTASDIGTLNAYGRSRITITGDTSIDTFRLAGTAEIHFKATGTLGSATTSNMHRGTVITFENNTDSAVTFRDLNQWGGTVQTATTTKVVSFSSITQYGGVILLDEGRTITN